jgi:hypothetical protein
MLQVPRRTRAGAKVQEIEEMNTLTFGHALRAACFAVVTLVLASAAQADIGDGTVRCTDSNAADATLNPSYVSCSAFFENGVQSAPQSTLVEPFGPSYGDFLYVGQTTSALNSTGPFEPFGPGLEFGTLTLKTPQAGSFVIALASNGDYSLFLYNATSISGGVVSIDISTIGTTGALGSFPLEYANLYAPVPELETYALMLVGLALTWLAVRHRMA